MAGTVGSWISRTRGITRRLGITGTRGIASKHAGWRRLGVFWVAVLSLMATGTGVVQWLGPPTAASLEASGPKSPDAEHLLATTPAGTPAGQALSPPVVVAGPGLVAPVVAGRDTPGPVADPDPTLAEPLSEGSKESLPRIASDGHTAMKTYAAGFDHSSRRPRIGLLLAGIGMNEAESEAAIHALPGAVSLAVSPYAASNGTASNGTASLGAAANGANLVRLLAAARTTGHEYLIAIPLEPAGFPLNDPGPSTLLTGASAAENARNLHWALSRIGGYVGATGVIGTMRGERLAAMTDQMEAVLSELSERGLLYVDPREGGGPISKAWGRRVDLVIDDPADQGVADRTMIDARLAALEQQARDAGSALGLVMRPTPVAVARIAAWSNGLANRGLALAPVSALAMSPADVPVKLSERQ
jgi:polysaccharide deacetylase 2 family uncharacterized protein YibQ